MPTNSADQQITTPLGPDAASAMVGFTDFLADVEGRLVRRYTNEADRAARDLAPTAGQISHLATPDILIWRDAARLRELIPLVAFKATETQLVNNSTAFVNDSHLSLPLNYTTARYVLSGLLVWDSGTTGDIKFDWLVPAGATIPRWTVLSIDTGTGALAGNFNAGQSANAATPLARGGAGIGTFVAGWLIGTVLVGGTAGTLQLRWAQNGAEAVNTRVKTDSFIRLDRVA